MSRYSPTLVDHARYPRNNRRLRDADAVGTSSLNERPPFVTFFLRIEGESVVEACFDAHGCGVTIASCSALTELGEERSLDQCLELKVEEVVEFLDGVPFDKLASPRVALAAFQRAALRYRESRAV